MNLPKKIFQQFQEESLISVYYWNRKYHISIINRNTGELINEFKNLTKKQYQKELNIILIDNLMDI